MRTLLLDDEAREKVQRVLDFALREENWYRPNAADDRAVAVPGDDKRFTTHLDTYRCVFSLTAVRHARPIEERQSRKRDAGQ